MRASVESLTRENGRLEGSIEGLQRRAEEHRSTEERNLHALTRADNEKLELTGKHARASQELDAVRGQLLEARARVLELQEALDGLRATVATEQAAPPPDQQ